MVSASEGSLPSPATVREWLEEVTDPEIPVLNVVEMGIVRDVQVGSERIGALKAVPIVVAITPTYSGCPAMQEIEDGIVSVLRRRGFDAEVRVVYSPAWSTDWMSEGAKEKLRRYGIAPPPLTQALVTIGGRSESPACPYCGSHRTELRSEFGSTPCKSMHFCCSCKQPFEGFKAI